MATELKLHPFLLRTSQEFEDSDFLGGEAFWFPSTPCLVKFSRSKSGDAHVHAAAGVKARTGLHYL